MEEVNLLSLVQANNNLSELLFERYLNNLGVSLKKRELKDLEIFIKELQNANLNSHFLNNFYVGFTIPQISKEFDLLKFGKKIIVNIEIKGSSTKDKILKQLSRNKYYLSFLERDVYSYTYVVDENKLYKLNNSEDLEETTFTNLIELLHSQVLENVKNLYTLFNPSNYLISPFNSTKEFINDCYFLTNQQEEFKKKTLEIIRNKSNNFISVIGNAGTGKTLLTYDIAKSYRTNRRRVLIIHCGILNTGHQILINDYLWDIIAAKDLHKTNLEKFSLLIVDETQRIYKNQIKNLINHVKKTNVSCIFSYDPNQCLQKDEINNDIGKLIYETTDSVYFRLTKKIRTNKEIANFIQCLFDRKRKIENIHSSNIKLNFFSCYENTKEHLKFLKSKGWKIVNYTPSSRYSPPYCNFALLNENSAHEVVGQEFNKVVAVVDSFFYYDEYGKLSTKGFSKHPPYHPTKMLFQILTRARIELNFIIINNEEILDRCLSILEQNQFQLSNLITMTK